MARPKPQPQTPHRIPPRSRGMRRNRSESLGPPGVGLGRPSACRGRSMYVYTYSHVCVHIYIYIYIYTYTYIHIHIYIYTYIHMYISMCRYIYIYIWVCVYETMHANEYTYMSLCMQTQSRVHLQRDTHELRSIWTQSSCPETVFAALVGKEDFNKVQSRKQTATAAARIPKVCKS